MSKLKMDIFRGSIDVIWCKHPIKMTKTQKYTSHLLTNAGSLFRLPL